MPEDMPDRMSNRMPEDMSDRMPQDLPVRKCINVMVGITRSKVIFLIGGKISTKTHGFTVNHPDSGTGMNTTTQGCVKRRRGDFPDFSLHFVRFSSLHQLATLDDQRVLRVKRSNYILLVVRSMEYIRLKMGLANSQHFEFGVIQIFTRPQMGNTDGTSSCSTDRWRDKNIVRIMNHMISILIHSISVWNLLHSGCFWSSQRCSWWCQSHVSVHDPNMSWIKQQRRGS